MSFVHELFGGAIIAHTVPNLIDASDLRPVPDTQEVLLYPDSSVSIIVEILQRVQSSTNDGAIRFHFESLAHDNSAQSTEVEGIFEISNDTGDDTPPAIVLKGVQLVPKFNSKVPDKVRIMMAVFRVESKEMDVVVTFNIPIISADGGAVGDDEGLARSEMNFDTFVRSFRIIDLGLFA